MIDVAKDRPYLRSMSNMFSTLERSICRKETSNLPGKNVLRMVVSQIDLGGAANRNALSLAVIRFDEVRHWKVS